MRAFELRIQPFHTDKCGGLKLLGNFCFGLVTPLLIGSGLIIGYIFIFFISASISGIRIDAVFLVIVAGSILLLLLLFGVPEIILAFILPLRDIHIKMVSERETDEDTYNAHIEALREEIQSLLNNNMLEEAKVLQEKKALLETSTFLIQHGLLVFARKSSLQSWGRAVVSSSEWLVQQYL